MWRYVASCCLRPKAALSLQAAARQFMAKNSSDQKMLKHVILQSSCEIDKDCQTVLRQTYGHCNYPDILDLNLGSKKGNYCTVHGKFCKPPPTSSGRTLLKSSHSVVEFCTFNLFVHLSFKVTSLQWDIRASSRSGIDVNIAGAFLSCKAFSFCANAFQNQHEFGDACHVAIFDFYRSSMHLIFDDGEPGL